MYRKTHEKQQYNTRHAKQAKKPFHLPRESHYFSIYVFLCIKVQIFVFATAVRIFELESEY
jgi:hypothetical protein